MNLPDDPRLAGSTRYLTVAEYAASRRVSVRVVRAEIKKGRIKAERIGKEYRIPVPDDS